MSVYDAVTLATGLLGVAPAAGRDKVDAQVYKAFIVEEYDAPTSGLRISATDRRTWLTAWVPDLLATTSEPPGRLVDPARVVVASDHHGRGRSLAGFLLQLANQVKGEQGASSAPTNACASPADAATPPDQEVPR